MRVVYGTNGSGGHNVGVEVDGHQVLIQSSGPEDDAACVRLAESIENAGTLAEQLEETKRRHAEELAAAKAANEALRARLAQAEASLRAAIEGERRFFGPALCVPANAGDWSGPVWLLDPEKRENGFGLRFESVRELRAAHPELWIVDVTDGGVLVDAVPLPQRGDNDA